MSSEVIKVLFGLIKIHIRMSLKQWTKQIAKGETMPRSVSQVFSASLNMLASYFDMSDGALVESLCGSDAAMGELAMALISDKGVNREAVFKQLAH